MQWYVGDSVISRKSGIKFPGQVVALGFTPHQVIVQSYGDSDGNYAGLVKAFTSDELEPYEFGNGTGSPFLVIDPERDLVAQVRAFCDLHPEKSPLGLAQLHAFLVMVDEGERQKPPQVFHDATPFGHTVEDCKPIFDNKENFKTLETPFVTQDGNEITRYDPEICLGLGTPDGRHNWLVDGQTDEATCEYCGKVKNT